MQVGLKANEIDREVDEDYGLQRIRLGLGERVINWRIPMGQVC